MGLSPRVGVVNSLLSRHTEAHLGLVLGSVLSL